MDFWISCQSQPLVVTPKLYVHIVHRKHSAFETAPHVIQQAKQILDNIFVQMKSQSMTFLTVSEQEGVPSSHPVANLWLISTPYVRQQRTLLKSHLSIAIKFTQPPTLTFHIASLCNVFFYCRKKYKIHQKLCLRCKQQSMHSELVFSTLWFSVSKIQQCIFK